MHSSIIIAFIASLAITGTVAGPVQRAHTSKRQFTEPSCAADVSAANQVLREAGALISGELFASERPPLNEAQCPGILTFLNGVAAENGIANIDPFPLDAPFPIKKRQAIASCADVILEANQVLTDNSAIIGADETFTAIFPPSNEAGCEGALSFLNGVAAENGVANIDPFPLNAPFPGSY